MDIRIGITHAPREISIEIEDDETAVNQIKALAEAALSGMSTTFTVTDRRGRQVVVPSANCVCRIWGTRWRPQTRLR